MYGRFGNTEVNERLCTPQNYGANAWHKLHIRLPSARTGDTKKPPLGGQRRLLTHYSRGDAHRDRSNRTDRQLRKSWGAVRASGLERPDIEAVMMPRRSMPSGALEWRPQPNICSWGRFSFRGGAIDDDTISENGSSWFWANLFDRSAGKMCLPVHQRTDAVRLFERRRYGSGKLPNVGVSDDGPYRSSDPTSSTSTAWDVGVFAAARAPRLSLGAKRVGRQPPA